MGELKEAKCKDCGNKFEFSTIGGFNFAIINCDSCHRAKSISWDEKKQDNEHGQCECGGTYTNNAVPRCTKCDSPNLKNVKTKLYFD